MFFTFSPLPNTVFLLLLQLSKLTLFSGYHKTPENVYAPLFCSVLEAEAMRPMLSHVTTEEVKKTERNLLED
jgi:hypothetical protein